VGEFNKKDSRDRFFFASHAKKKRILHFLFLRRKTKKKCFVVVCEFWRAGGTPTPEEKKSADLNNAHKKARFSFATFSRTLLIRAEVFLSFACREAFQKRTKRAQPGVSNRRFFFHFLVPFQKR
jgi:hypothetical protein